jgi:hypothetical protein
MLFQTLISETNKVSDLTLIEMCIDILQVLQTLQTELC